MMTNKIIVFGVIGVLVGGLVLLGVKVKKLSAEVSQLSSKDAGPAPATKPAPQTAVPKFTRPDNSIPSFNNRWDPYSELANIQRQMNQLFNASFNGGLWPKGMLAENSLDLSTDIQDTQNKYVISMDIPGMEKENINVEVKNNMLLVSGERNNENEEKDTNYYKQERSFGYFSQSLPLPADADSAGISVKYNNGVLKIEIPKLAQANVPEPESTKIKVN